MRALWHGYTERSWSLPFVPLALLATLARLSAAGDELPKQRVVELGGGVEMVFLLIPPGTFTMGSTEADIKAFIRECPDDARDEWFFYEKPAHKVTLTKAFYMGKHEVTVGQFRRFVEATCYRTDAETGKLFKGVPFLEDNKWKIAADASWRNPPHFKQTDRHPVVCVSWDDARRFAEWLDASDEGKPAGCTYRLPTESEWEYAARGPRSLLYPWGNAWDATRCNFAGKGTGFAWDDMDVDDGHPRTAPVGSFSPKGDSPFGLCDMAGNVWEWCEDRSAHCAVGCQTCPAGPAEGAHRVQRGGAWGNDPSFLHSASRLGDTPAHRHRDLGFRLVLAPGHK